MFLLFVFGVGVGVGVAAVTAGGGDGGGGGAGGLPPPFLEEGDISTRAPALPARGRS